MSSNDDRRSFDLPPHWRLPGLQESAKQEDLAACPAGIAIGELAQDDDALEHYMHGDGSFDRKAGVYRLYARRRQA